MKLNKIKIEELAKDVLKFLIKNEIDEDVRIFFNNKRMYNKRKYDGGWNCIGNEIITEADVCPLDYFEYAADNHILSMSFEGNFYDCINYSGLFLDEFEALLEKYGLYYELGESWNLTCYPSDGEYDGIEYTDYSSKREPEPIRLSLQKDMPNEIKNIMISWYELSKTVGDGGSCVLGAGFEFKYKDEKYFMSAVSPYQGSISWETHKDTIELMLKNIGATEIRYDWGRMD